MLKWLLYTIGSVAITIFLVALYLERNSIYSLIMSTPNYKIFVLVSLVVIIIGSVLQLFNRIFVKST